MIDVAFTDADARPCDVAVVIDVLRATSTIAQALASGYRRVLCVESIEEALEMRRPGRILAGERNCVVPPGFDCDNSPQAMLERTGKELVLTTSNGTVAIVAAAHRARTVLLASALNLAAVTTAIDALTDPGESVVQLVCAGGSGRPCIEDAYVAGMIARELRGARSDSALIAEALAQRYGTASQALRAAAHARVLADRGLDADLAICARTSALSTVPTVTDAEEDVAVVLDIADVAAIKVPAP